MLNLVCRTLLMLGLVTSFMEAATLEKLSLEEMSAKATLIVRGRVTGCAGEARGSMIYTRCALLVSERWKGQAGSQLNFYIPGGSTQGLRQVITGAPKLAGGDEYVLFLWTGRSGINHVIGLSQGVFDLTPDAKGVVTARRDAATTVMLDRSGNHVADEALELRVSELRQRVKQALATEAKQ
jgi:hypothetical protein